MEDKTKEFKTRPAEWRIEAVIHDGTWYDVKKWARVAKVTEADIRSWLKSNKKKVIQSDVDESYRTSYDEIIDWYSNQTDITLEDKIIPKNYPPRLWDGKTEAEWFIDVPRRKTATVTFSTDDDELLKQITVALAGVARVRYEKGGKHRAFGLSDEYIRQVLVKTLSKKEMESLNIKRRKAMLQRELTDFSPEFIEQALTFYLPFSRNTLKSHMSTLKIYLPEEGDIDSQIIAWIVAAMRKFDEKQPVPFSGYLSNVLRFWPYDLPDEVLGKELSSFQRQRQKAFNSLAAKHQEERTWSNAEVSEEMDIPIEDFIRLNNQHETWLGEKNATTLNWSDSSNEKQGTLLGQEDEIGHDSLLAHQISMATINSALKTYCYEDANKVINSIDTNGEIEDALSELSPEFKAEFANELIKAGAIR